MIFGNYSSTDLQTYALTAKEQNLKLYIEYIGKKKQQLKPMQVTVLEVYNDHILVIDLFDGRIKRLNYSRVYRVGLEVENA